MVLYCSYTASDLAGIGLILPLVLDFLAKVFFMISTCWDTSKWNKGLGLGPEVE